MKFNLESIKMTNEENQTIDKQFVRGEKCCERRIEEKKIQTLILMISKCWAYVSTQQHYFTAWSGGEKEKEEETISNHINGKI